MEKNELYFDSLSGGENKRYAPSNLLQQATKIQEEIAGLQVKLGIINSFIHVNDIFKDASEKSFATIHSVTCTKNWHAGQFVADDYGTDEEYFVFSIATDTATFSVLLEFLGDEPTLNKTVFYLHAPSLPEENIRLIEEAVLQQFVDERKEQLIVTHPYQTVDQALQVGMCEVVCQKEVENRGYNPKILWPNPLLQKGKKYLVKKEHYWVIVYIGEGNYIRLTAREAESHFPTL